MLPKVRRLGWLVVAACALAAAPALAQTPVGTAFTYQGRLTDNGSPATGERTICNWCSSTPPWVEPRWGRGFRLGFGGALTFERALQIRRLAAGVPETAIVLETDAPDIPPQWLYRTAAARDDGNGRFVRQTGGKGQYGHVML